MKSVMVSAGGNASSVRTLSGLLLVLACCACGSHESKPPSKQTGGTISDAVMAAGHSASGEPSAGAPVAGSSVPAGPSIVCGSNTCSTPSTLSSMLGGGLFPQPVACCFDEAEGTCGVAPNDGAQCQPPATPDDRCPSIDVRALAGAIGVSAPGGTVAGCCVDDACGVDGALFGRGCVENSQAKTLLGSVPVIGPLVMVPAPRACVE